MGSLCEELCRSYAGAMQRLRRGSAGAVQGLCRGYARATPGLSRGYAGAMRLCKGNARAMNTLLLC